LNTPVEWKPKNASKARSDVVDFGNSAFDKKLSAISAEVKAQEAVVEHSQGRIDLLAGSEDAEYALRKANWAGFWSNFSNWSRSIQIFKPKEGSRNSPNPSNSAQAPM
jgi:hypothetical protein